MAKPTIDLPPATIHTTKPMFFTNQHTATNYQSKLSKANTSQLQTHLHLNLPQNLATHDHNPPKEGRHGGDLPSGTAAIHPVARRNPSRHDGDPLAARRRSVQQHDGDPRCDGDPSSGGMMAILGIQTDDLQILMKLKSTFLQTSNTSAFSSWESSNSMCNFTGITCNSDNLVTEIKLSNHSLTGVLPLDSICHLQSLEKLSFGFNSLNCPIMGCSVPDISSLSQLQYLYLNGSKLSGTFPYKSLQNMIGLAHLSLGDNLFNPFPFPKEVLKLTNLTLLYLYNCSDLSELRFLNNLASLSLFDNNFSGQVPSEFGKFKKLVNLSLYRNSFTGALPQELGSLVKFYGIDASENFFFGPIPPNMCKQGTMRLLLLLQNNLTGEIPASYANCSTLLRFGVNNNSLSGSVPAGIWGLPNVNIIDITSNRINGPITSDIKNAKFLGQLFAANNRLSGELPAEISEATSLISIDLSDNQLSATERQEHQIWLLELQLCVLNLESSAADLSSATDFDLDTAPNSDEERELDVAFMLTGVHVNVEANSGDEVEELPTLVEGQSNRCAEKRPAQPVHLGGKKKKGGPLSEMTEVSRARLNRSSDNRP
nr:receptor-like protein kinase haiku2 [Quercus suber]